MKLKKLVSTLLACTMIVGLLAACGGDKTVESKNPDPQQSEERTEPYKLGMISLGNISTSMVAASKSIQDMCDTAGVELVTVQIAGYDDQAILTSYENLLNMGVDGVVGIAISESPIRLLSDLFEEHEVDWFLTNRKISDPSLEEYVFGQPHFVGNDYCSEEDNAYELVKRLHEDYGVNNLAVIGLTQGDVNGDLRDKGINRACEDLGIKLLTETRGVAAVADVTNAVEGIISSYPEVDGIFIVGGLITNGALAGANQALVNHNMQDKVAIGMIDIAAGMEEYMGEGKPLKVVAGGNLVMDQVLAAASMINHLNGINTDKTPYVLNTRMMFITSPEDSVDFATYYENPDRPMLSGSQWNDTVLGKSLDEMQSFVNDFTIAYAKSMNK